MRSVRKGERMNQWQCHLPFVHVRTSWFPHSLIAAKVEQVVHELEGDAQFHTKTYERTCMFVIQARHQACRVAPRGKRSCGFATHDGKVVLGRGGKVEDVVELMVFRNRYVGTAAGNDRYVLLGVATTEGKHVNKEPIACNHRLGLASLRMNGRNAAPLLRFIVDVIVNQGCGVNQLTPKRGA